MCLAKPPVASQDKRLEECAKSDHFIFFVFFSDLFPNHVENPHAKYTMPPQHTIQRKAMVANHPASSKPDFSAMLKCQPSAVSDRRRLVLAACASVTQQHSARPKAVACSSEGRATARGPPPRHGAAEHAAEGSEGTSPSRAMAGLSP
mmetsp:Transcript_40000/g.128285  ORF Transcript_40000/g.128285 Transcript_40000/m.128285 type:complete len:148 (-) Transcript_40000:1-444(-)